MKSLLPFSKLMSTRFSTPFAAKSRFAGECGRKFFRSLACTPRLSTCDSGSVFFPAHTSQHIAWRFGGSHWPLGARLCGRLPSQAGSPHCHGSLCIYPKSTLSWQRHSGSRGGNCSALVDLRLNPDCLLRGVLFHRDAGGGGWGPPSAPGLLPRVRLRRPASYS